jgi:hypothetical protein
VVARNQHHRPALKCLLVPCPVDRPPPRVVDIAGQHNDIELEIRRQGERDTKLQVQIRQDE